jgi:hypothetical protein
MRPFTALFVVVLTLLGACASDSGSDDAIGTAATTAEAATTSIEAPTTDATTPTTDVATPEPETSEPTTSSAPTTEPTPTLPDPAPWDGPRFDEAIEPTMAALAVGIGQPISAAAVAPEIVLPDGVPTPGGTVIGAGWVSGFDPRRGEYELEYSVGLESAITPNELQAWQDGVGGGWRAPSFAESGSFFTSLIIDEQDQRLVHLLDTDAAANERPPLNLEWSPNADSLLEPDWLAALPRPDGGLATEVSAARGIVTFGLGGAGFDGHVFVRFDYEVDELDRMVDYFEDGVLVGAGFEYEPEPLSNTRYRRDVAIGDWSGQVQIGEATANDVEYLQVIWQLTRGAS